MDEDEARWNPYAEPVFQQLAEQLGVSRDRLRLTSGRSGSRIEIADEQGRWPADPGAVEAG
jgi:hypothetical protein